MATATGRDPGAIAPAEAAVFDLELLDDRRFQEVFEEAREAGLLPDELIDAGPTGDDEYDAWERRERARMEAEARERG